MEEDAVFLGYEAALMANRYFETSVTGYRMMERFIPEQHLCYFETPRRGIAENKFYFVNLVILSFQYTVIPRLTSDTANEFFG